MKFLCNHKEEINSINNKNENYNNYNQNYLNFPLNDVPQSFEDKDFESRFINYDLGKTLGTSQTKDSLIVFGNDEKLFKSKKIMDISKNQNYFVEEKEKTKDELEKLAEQYVNISKNLYNQSIDTISNINK